MYRIVITAVGGGGVGEQILKALRLASEDYYIVGCDMQQASKGLYETDKGVVIPPANSPEYIETLLRVCQEEQAEVLFLGSEPEIKQVSAHRARFEEAGIFLPINSPEVLDLCFNKLKTTAWLKENGFPAPETILVSQTDMLKSLDKYPVVLKPHLSSGGSTNVFIAQDSEEVALFGTYLLRLYDSFIAQQYIGTPFSEYTVGVLLDMDGTLINSIAVKKNILSGLSNKIKISNRTQDRSLGEILAISSGISQGDIGRYNSITRQCEEIALKMGCRGAVNIQCRVVDDVVYVFEINPRLSGTTSLRAMVGYNEPQVLIDKHLCHKPIQQHFEYQAGTIMRGLSERFVPLSQ